MATEVTLEAIRVLRERTGAGIVDCKTALAEAGGDLEKAITILRERGKIKAAKKADRTAAEGVIGVYLHSNKKIAALVSLRCETDFVARSDRFQELARDLAMHIAASDPVAVKPEDLSADMLAAEREIVEREVAAQGKPAEIQQKMIAGRLEKFSTERALLTQPFVKDPSRTVADLITDAVTQLGENIYVATFTRMVL